MRILILPIILVALVILYFSAYVVDQRQQAVVFQIGKILYVVDEPGLHFMRPFVNNVKKFEKRLLTLDSRPETVLTGEKKNVIVDYFVKWRIKDVQAYYLAYNKGDMAEVDIERSAKIQLSEAIKDSLQGQLNTRTIKQVVSDDRERIMKNLATTTNQIMNKYGIEVVDVRIKKIELEQEILDSVYERMKAERERIAKEHRAKGEKEANIIRAKADRKRIEKLAEATRKSQTTRGFGDAEATRIYAEAYTKDSEFYAFYRSLQGYQKTFSNKSDVIVLEPDSEFFKYFDKSSLR